MEAENTKFSGAPRPSAGGVVLNSEGKLLLVFQHNNSWSFPKGGVELGENELDAAQREIFEETGLQNLILLCELGSYYRYSIGPDGVGEALQWGMRKRTLFLFKTTDERLRPDRALSGGEITDARWVALGEALQLLTHPKDKEFLASVRGVIEKTINEAN